MRVRSLLVVLLALALTASACGDGDEAVAPEAADLAKRLSLSEEQLALLPDFEAIVAATASFRDVAAAEAAGYQRDGPCTPGAGVHYVFWDLVHDPAVELEQPEVLMYEPVDGSLELIAVEYMVWGDDVDQPPEVLGGPMRGTLTLPHLPRPFYWLHVWVWKPNLSGLHSLLNPEVTC